MVNINQKGNNKMKKYQVRCQETSVYDTVVGTIYFNSKNRMISFCKQWTKGTEKFCHVSEYQEADYFNDYQNGYQWVYSFQYGTEVASYNNPYWKKAKLQLSSVYGRMCY